MRCIAAGWRGDKIARHCGIVEKGVTRLVEGIKDKLEASTRAQIVAIIYGVETREHDLELMFFKFGKERRK